MCNCDWLKYYRDKGIIKWFENHWQVDTKGGWMSIHYCPNCNSKLTPPKAETILSIISDWYITPPSHNRDVYGLSQVIWRFFRGFINKSMVELEAKIPEADIYKEDGVKETLLKLIDKERQKK